MPTHHPTTAQALMRFAHFSGIERKPKATPGKAAKAVAPVPAKRPARVQAPAPQSASGFAHLNANLPPVQPQAMLSKRAAEPTAQELAAQILNAGKPRPPAPPRTEAEKIAARILATHTKLRPQR